MKLRLCFVSLVVLAGLAGPLAAAGLVTETWRSAWGAPFAVAADPSDGSVWAVVGSSLYHLSADGGVLLRRGDFWGPQAVAVNTADGSCWVADSSRNQVVHLSAAGEELWRGGEFVYPVFVTVNPADGSVWVGQGGRNFAMPDVAGKPEVIHLAADGTVLWESDAYGPAALAVSPSDGACWLRDYYGSRLVRLSPSGDETVSLDGFISAGQIGVGLADGSVWVADFIRQQVVHVSASGEELWRGADVAGPGGVTVNPDDGSVWVLALDVTYTGPPPSAAEVVHLSASGAELWRRGGFRESVATTPLAVNPTDGSLWVADAADAALVRLEADGTELVRLRGFDDPVAVAVSPADHTVWVGDHGRSRMVQLDREGQELRVVTGYWPVSLAVNPSDGTVWEVDVVSTLVHFSSDGTELWRKDLINMAPIVAVDPGDGSAWVRAGDSVIHFSANGDEVWRGTGLGSVLAVDPADGSLWGVLYEGTSYDGDLHGHLVHRGADGQEIWRSPEEMFGDPFALSIDPRDRSIRVADYSRDEVVSLTPWGTQRWRTEVGFVPYSVAVDPRDGACWVAVYGGSSVVLLGADGAVLWRGAGFAAPQSVSVDPSDGACWVADTGDSQVVRLERLWFTDVPLTHWASDAIYACVAAGIVNGYGSGRYRPSLAVTRDQMAVYLARALAGGDAAVPAGPPQPPFTDVGADHWAYRYIAYCAEAGVVQGYPGGAYHPDQVVNRAQMAAYLARAIADPVGDAGVPDYQESHFFTFADVSPAHWAWRYVEYLFARGIVQGYPSNLYAPEAPVTRDQMAVYLARAFLE
jgi:DNA-binding beta-propeller fold protein YncE